MTGYVLCPEHGFSTAECSVCPSATFLAPRPSDEALVAAIASMLHGRVDGVSGTYADLDHTAEKLAREISQVLLSRFHITKRG